MGYDTGGPAVIRAFVYYVGDETDRAYVTTDPEAIRIAVSLTEHMKAILGSSLEVEIW